jgi:hypothetical protein
MKEYLTLFLLIFVFIFCAKDRTEKCAEYGKLGIGNSARYNGLGTKEHIRYDDNGDILLAYKDEIQVAQNNKQEMLDEDRRKEERRKEEKKFSENYNYQSLIEQIKSDGIIMCPPLDGMLRHYFIDEVESVHLQKIDAIHLRKRDSVGGFFSSDSIDPRSFQQKLKTLCGLSDDNKNIDSVMAFKIAAVAAAECYGSKMTPFAATLMGGNKEHWMVYCFPTIPDNIKQQKSCYNIRRQDHEQGLTFHPYRGATSCPVVFSVLISVKNGQVLAISIPY